MISKWKFQHDQLHYPIRQLFYKDAVLSAYQEANSWLEGAGDNEDANKRGWAYTTKQLRKIKRSKKGAYKRVIAGGTWDLTEWKIVAAWQVTEFWCNLLLSSQKLFIFRKYKFIFIHMTLSYLDDKQHSYVCQCLVVSPFCAFAHIAKSTYTIGLFRYSNLIGSDCVY